MVYPSKEELRRLLTYNEVSGDFTWNVNKSSRARAGKVAGTKSSDGVYIRIDGRNYAAHRLAFIYIDGVLPSEGHNVDHKDCNHYNNSWGNLRISTFSQNSCNRRVQSNSKSGIKNISFYKNICKWRVAVSSKGVGSYEEFFDDLELAMLVASEARILYHKDFARS